MESEKDQGCLGSCEKKCWNRPHGHNVETYVDYSLNIKDPRYPSKRSGFSPLGR